MVVYKETKNMKTYLTPNIKVKEIKVRHNLLAVSQQIENENVHMGFTRQNIETVAGDWE